MVFPLATPLLVLTLAQDTPPSAPPDPAVAAMWQDLSAAVDRCKAEALARDEIEAGPSTLAQGAPPPAVYGSLDKAVIDAAIKAHMGEIRVCYQSGLPVNSTLAGKVTVRFVIAPDGSVSLARIKATTLRDEEVEHCIQRRFLTFEFPEPKDDGIVVVSYPFIFAPGSLLPVPHYQQKAVEACLADVQPMQGATLEIAVHFTRRRPDEVRVLLAEAGEVDRSACLVDALHVLRSRSPWVYDAVTTSAS